MMKKSKMNLFMATATAAVLVATVAAPVQTEAASKSFKDIPKSHPYYKEITEMAAKGIISGYEDGNFKPEEMISRKHAAALISRAYPDLKVEYANVTLNDVKTSSPYYKDIVKVAKAGAISSRVKFDWKPDEKITRGDMAKAIATSAQLESNSKSGLTDVTSRYSTYVNALYDYGITTGYEDKTFKEDKQISRAHYAVFMYRAMQAQKSGGKSNSETKLDTLYKSTEFSKGSPTLTGKTPMESYRAFESKVEEYITYTNESRVDFRLSITPLYGFPTFVEMMERFNISEKEYMSFLDKAYNGEFVKTTYGSGKKLSMYFDFKSDALAIVYEK